MSQMIEAYLRSRDPRWSEGEEKTKEPTMKSAKNITAKVTLTFGFGAPKTNARGGRNHSAVPDLPYVEISTSWPDASLDTAGRYWRSAPSEWETIMGAEMAPNFAEFIEFLFGKHQRYERRRQDREE